MWWIIGLYCAGSLVGVGMAAGWMDEGLIKKGKVWVYFWMAVAWLPLLLFAAGARLARLRYW